MKKKFLIPVVIIVVAFLVGAFIRFNRPRDREITLALTYVPNVQFAPWYVAAEKGFFREENLEVKFDYRMDIDALQLVGAGEMEFAIAGGDQLLTASSRGIPVVYLLSLYAKFPPAVIALSETGINNPQDLKGKKIGLPLYGTNLLAIKAILNRAGIKEDEVELVDIGYTQIPSLTQKKVHAVVGFANNEPIKLKAQGYEVTEIDSWDYFSLVGHGLITGKDYMSSAPEVVRGMVRATLKGMRHALDHPDEAFEISLKHLPELAEAQKELEREVLTASMKLWESDYTRQVGLGYSNPDDWEDSQRLMVEMGLIDRSAPIEEILDFTFLSE